MRVPPPPAKHLSMSSHNEYQQIDILIPGYSIEDIPSDLPEKSAASLLNAVATAWHPAVLLAARSLPSFTQAEATELPTGQHIVFIPECSEEWLGHDWPDHFDDTLSLVISECHQRDDYLNRITAALPDTDRFAPDVVRRFLALGTCYMQVTLLSRRMHHYVDPDNYLLETETLAAAEAAAAGNTAGCEQHLQRCFECLLDCREQFYPVDCYFVDVCLPSDQTTAAELVELLSDEAPLSLICSGEELDRFGQSTAFRETVVRRLNEDSLSLLTGHRHELRTSLSSLSAVYTDLNQSPQWLSSPQTTAPLHWARRRFGLTAGLPSILSHFEFASALHVVLDDGIYPDREYGQLSWQGPDGTTLNAVSRIPMAIDGAAAFLRFPDRYTESMQEDTNAVALLARLPEVRTPWLTDLKLAAQYAPVLGRFVTFGEFVAQMAGQSSPTKFQEGEYLSPYLIQSSVLKTEAPITSPQQLHLLRDQVEHAASLAAIAAILRPADCADQELEELREQINAEEGTHLDLSAPPESTAAMARVQELSSHVAQRVRDLESSTGRLSPGADGTAASLLLLNSLPWKRRAAFAWPSSLPLPVSPDPPAEFWQQGSTTYCSTEIPAGGFLWFRPADGGRPVKPARPGGKPLAEDLLLRNSFYELHISEATGGIAEVRFHNQRPNRVSQLVSLRYESPQTVRIEDEELVCAYAATQMVQQRVVESGPFRGQIETTSQIIDVGTEERLATIRQTITVERDSPRLHLRIDVDELNSPITGNPWMTYLACRFAWDNESASISRSMLGQTAGFRMERFEAPDYIEVADSDQRLVILPHGRPYHRRSGARMLDSLLIVEGETARSFDFHLDFDQPVPMRSVLETRRPVVLQQPESRQPGPAQSGWLLGLSSKNVIIARSETQPGPDGATVRLLLQETEGRATACRLVTARPAAQARVICAHGGLVQQLEPAANGTIIEMGPFQIREVELIF